MDEKELARACAAALYARDTAARKMGITVVHMGPGESQLAMTVRADMLNGHAICHGGYLFSLADTAFAYACNSRDEVNVAQTCNIDFLRAAEEGERLTATATEQSRVGRSGIFDVVVKRENDEVIAHFRGLSRRIEGRVIRDE